MSEWANNWELDQVNVIRQLRSAASNDNHSEIMHVISKLEGMTTKRFTALKNTLRTVSDPDRILNDIRLKDIRREGNNIVSSDTKEITNNEETENFNSQENKLTEEELLTEIVKEYNAGMTIKEMATWNGIGIHKVVKILVTAGVYSSDTYDKIKNMREYGFSDAEISKRLGMKESTLNDYTPYRKGIYNSKNATQNAKNIRKYRENKKGL